MKKLILIGILPILIFSCCVKVGPEIPKGDIRKQCESFANIPDPNLFQAIAYRTGTDANGNICAEMLQYVDYLSIQGQVNDFSGLEGLTNLQELYIYNNTLSDLSFLSKIPQLKRLTIYNCIIADTKGFASVPGLLTLGINSCDISFYNELDDLTNLTWLSVNESNFKDSDLAQISGLTKIYYLWLGYEDNITSLTALSGLLNLTQLDVYHCQVTSLSPVSGLTKLSSLRVGFNALASLDGISGLPNLYELSAESNIINDISAIAGAGVIMYVNLSGNSITAIDGLSGLTGLRNIVLSNNSIASVYPLYQNMQSGGFGPGVHAYLTNNPLNPSPDIDTYIPALIANGAEIYY